MEEIIVMVGYKPKEGKAKQLQQLMREHLLKQQNLVTERISIMMEAKDRTIIEVFGWKSRSAIEQAHTNPAVLKMWEKYAEVCDFIPVSTIKKTADVFAEFKPFN